VKEERPTELAKSRWEALTILGAQAWMRQRASVRLTSGAKHERVGGVRHTRIAANTLTLGTESRARLVARALTRVSRC
jgi:hypothetical protein